MGELRSLLPGDVVVLDGIDPATGLLVVGDRFVAPIELLDVGGRLTDRPRYLNQSRWKWIMTDKTAADAGQRLEDADLEDLPVTLVFELGRTLLPMGEIKRLGPGMIVPLAELKNETVDIIANGKRVGRGEIVRIGESLGVRVIGLFGNA